MYCLQRTLLLLILYISSGLGQFNVIELNHDLGPDTPYFDQEEKEPFKQEFTQIGYSNGFWSAYGKYRAFEHMSTHIHAPFSFNSYGLKVDELPIDQFFGQAAVIDISEKVRAHDNYKGTPEDIYYWIKANGVFPNNSIVLIRTDWEKGRYPDGIKYHGNSTISHPGISLDALKVILNHEESHGIRIVGMGIDCPKLDIGISKFFPVSSYLASKNKYVVVDMKSLEELPPSGARLMIAPLKLRGGASSQTRVYARLPYGKTV